MAFRKSVAPVAMNALQAALLGALAARPAAALFTGCLVKLYTADVVITPDTPAASFTEAVFVGYVARDAAAPTGPYRQEDANLYVHINAEWAVTTAPATPVAVRGYAITSADGTVVYLAEAFAAPVTFVRVGDSLVLDVVLPETGARQVA